MKFIVQKQCNQPVLLALSPEKQLPKDSTVRNSDAFVESLVFNTLDINMTFKDNDRTACQPKVLLNIFNYGYLNCLGSSIKLEKQYHISLEMK
jgi:hypothetical protein